MYAQELIDRIRNSVDIVGIIGERISLKKAGRNYKGLCPFHNEKTPSFTVSPEKQLYHCFGCGAGGNVFTFLTSIDKMGFNDALRLLAEKGGVRLPEKKAAIEEFSKLYEANEVAAHFFEDSVFGDRGKNARDYLNRRGVRDETVRELRLGFAPPGWRNLLDYAGKLLGEDLLQKAGLLIKDNESGATYDRFRERLIFPIENMSSRVIGFGGRALDDSPPKYLNSPETPVYRKSEVLYGFSRTRRAVREAGFAILVEGYMDFIALFESGIRNVVAISGTSLTSSHAKILKGSVDRALLVFDGDRAGVTAAMRGLGILLQGGLHVDVLPLPSGYDPDSCLRKNGKDNFLQKLGGSADAITFVRDHFASEKKDREEALRHVVEIVSRVEDHLSRRVLVERASQVFSFDEKILALETERRRSGERVMGGMATSQSQEPSGPKIELECLSLLMSSPTLSREVIELVDDELFSDPVLRGVARAIITGRTVLDKNGIAGLLDLVEDVDTKSLLARLAIEDEFTDVNREAVVRDYVRKLKEIALRRRANKIDEDMRKMEEQGADVTNLLVEKSGIMTELKGLYG